MLPIEWSTDSYNNSSVETSISASQASISRRPVLHGEKISSLRSDFLSETYREHGPIPLPPINFLPRRVANRTHPKRYEG